MTSTDKVKDGSALERMAVDLKQVLAVELTGFAEKSDQGSDVDKRGNKDDSQISGLNQWVGRGID